MEGSTGFWINSMSGGVEASCTRPLTVVPSLEPITTTSPLWATEIAQGGGRSVVMPAHEAGRGDDLPGRRFEDHRLRQPAQRNLGFQELAEIGRRHW